MQTCFLSKDVYNVVIYGADSIKIYAWVRTDKQIGEMVGDIIALEITVM